MSNLRSRMAKVVQLFPPERCPACGNHPSRLVMVDGATDEVLSESLPESGCPECGRVPYRTLLIVGEQGGPDVVAAI